MARAVAGFFVLLAIFVSLAYHVDGTGLASGYVDPIGKIAAQDEAVYSHIVLRMASDTPVVDFLFPMCFSF